MIMKSRNTDAKALPVVGFTTQKGLVLDFDYFDIETIERISRQLTKKYNLGDFLIAFSSWHGQLTLEHKKAIDAHVIFGAPTPCETVQEILKELVRKHIIDYMFCRFHEWEKELTIRVGPKKRGQRPPYPMKYVSTDGRDELIREYLSERKMSLKLLRLVSKTPNISKRRHVQQMKR